MENKINLFEIYNYHPYDSSKIYIDDLITTNEQNLIYEVFKKSFFFFNCDNNNWEKEPIEFLNLPIKEINKRWKEKAIYRKKYDAIYFMSNKKNAGKIGSKIILNYING